MSSTRVRCAVALQGPIRLIISNEQAPVNVLLIILVGPSSERILLAAMLPLQHPVGFLYTSFTPTRLITSDRQTDRQTDRLKSINVGHKAALHPNFISSRPCYCLITPHQTHLELYART